MVFAFYLEMIDFLFLPDSCVSMCLTVVMEVDYFYGDA